MFDISKLRKPNLIKYDLKDKITEYKEAVQAELAAAGIEWDAAPSDPMVKILKALAAMDCLRCQLTNETARKLLLAYAKGDDLDNIRPDIERLKGGNTIAQIKLKLRDGVLGTLLEGTEFRGGNDGEFKARTFEEYALDYNADPIQHEVTVNVEIYEPAGKAGNDPAVTLNRLLIASPMIESVEFVSNLTLGTDAESDERYRQRILLAPTSNMGGKRSYMYYALSADARIKEVYVETTAPGALKIYILPVSSVLADGNSLILQNDIQTKVEAALSDENNRPATDVVTVVSDGIPPEIVRRYTLSIDVHLLPGASENVVALVQEKAEKAVEELYSFGRDITKNAIAGMCYVSGVSGMDITIKDGGTTEVESINMSANHAAYCFEKPKVNLVNYDGGVAD